MIFLNSNCDYGAGLSKWKKIEKSLQDLIGDYDFAQIQPPDNFDGQLSEALEQGHTKFIAAGGDGTVNILLNSIMKNKSRNKIVLGAIGLGSSNDFHKPYRKEAYIGNIPVRIDFKNVLASDVISLKYKDHDGIWRDHFCLLNASIGLIAEANAFFNQRHLLTKILQRVSVDLAVLFTAIRTIFIYKNKPLQIVIDDKNFVDLNITNLSILKNPHFTGSLCYDTTVQPDDGKVNVDICTDLSLIERIRTFISLANGHFQGLPKTSCLTAENITVNGPNLFAVEMDGEVIYADNVKFNVLLQQVRICR